MTVSEKGGRRGSSRIANWLNLLARRAVLRKLRGLQAGCITINDAAGTTCFGADDSRRVTVQVDDMRFYRRLVFGGSLAAASSFIDGEWHCDDLTALLRMFARDQCRGEAMDRGWARPKQWLSLLAHLWRANSPKGSSKNVRAHYDLGNDFFRLGRLLVPPLTPVASP